METRNIFAINDLVSFEIEHNSVILNETIVSCHLPYERNINGGYFQNVPKIVLVQTI